MERNKARSMSHAPHRHYISSLIPQGSRVHTNCTQLTGLYLLVEIR